jgi:hypothetical protein
MFNNSNKTNYVQDGELCNGKVHHFETIARAERQAQSRAGLSYAHISPRGVKEGSLKCKVAKVKIWGQGNLIKAERSIERMHYGGGKRKKINGLSRAARRRMMYQLCMTQTAVKPNFVTLTYPDHFNTDPRVWKRDLDTFFKRMERENPGASAFWRLDLKVRKSGDNVGKVAPHYHILTWGVDYLELLVFVRKAWWEVVGSGNEDHYKAGVRVERIKTDNGVKRYAAKYASKIEGEVENYQIAEKQGVVGRLWGKFNSENIPWSSVEEIETDDKEVINLFRLMRRYAHLKMRSSTLSMTLMVNHPIQWARPLLC